MTTISAHTYDALREKCDELRAENARLRAELDAAPRWVSVTERLPALDQWVMARQAVSGNEYVIAAKYGYSRACKRNDWLSTDGWCMNGVTHWLELPPAPGAEVTR